MEFLQMLGHGAFWIVSDLRFWFGLSVGLILAMKIMRCKDGDFDEDEGEEE